MTMMFQNLGGKKKGPAFKQNEGSAVSHKSHVFLAFQRQFIYMPL